jgi:hypothetical protein
MTANEAAVRAWAEMRHLPESHLERWLSLPEADSSALRETAERLHLRTGQFVTAFALLEEIAVREKVNLAGVLARSEIRRILEGTGSTPGRARMLIDQLRAMRFPELKRTTDRIRSEVAALALPRGINVLLPRDLNSEELRIEISAHRGAELERLIEAIAKRAAGLKRIAAMVGGEDEL